MGGTGSQNRLLPDPVKIRGKGRSVTAIHTRVREFLWPHSGAHRRCEPGISRFRVRCWRIAPEWPCQL